MRARGAPEGPYLPAGKTYLLGNAGLEPLDWSAVTTADWVRVAPAEGTLGPGKQISVSVEIEAEEARRLMPGKHPALVYFANGTGGPGTTSREVELAIRAPAGLSVTPGWPLEVALVEGERPSPASRVYVLRNGSARSLAWRARTDRPWLLASPAEGTVAPGESALVDVRVDHGKAPGELGDYVGRVRFENQASGVATGAPAAVESRETPAAVREVRLRVGRGDGLVVTPGEDAALVPGGGETEGRASYTLRNRGSAPLAWQAEVVGDGLLVSETWGELEPSATAVVDVRAPAGARGAVVFVNRTDGLGTTTRRVSGEEEPREHPTTSSVSQFGITWTFDRDVEVGRFANGDFWVVGPVAVVGIEPRARRAGHRIMNGSMRNPSPSDGSQGYDSAMFGKYRSPGSYRDDLNVALDVSPASPLVLASDSSLVSTISVPKGGARPQLDTAAILTVLSAPAPEGSFRPPYCGTDKTPRHDVGELDRSLLARLEPTPSAPPIRRVAGWFERPWLDHIPDWIGRYHHPAQNMPDYGREMSDQIGTAALMLHLDLPLEEKETLLVRFVQLGIDLYGIVRDGGQHNWPAGGGHHSGRKWPILFAGLMLGDSEMSSIGERKNVAFNEDDQTFYVAETSPGFYNEGYGGYGPEHVGMAEWGNQHAKNRSQDDARWSDTDGSNKNLDYRTCCTANVWWGELLAARIMGAKGLWNHDALFDYQDRYREVSRTSGQPGWTVSWSPFMLEMWDRYRASY